VVALRGQLFCFLSPPGKIEREKLNLAVAKNFQRSTLYFSLRRFVSAKLCERSATF
jgi:hypothetical protein